MPESLLAPAFSLWGSPVTLLEIVAFVLSLAMVVCNLRVNIWGWPLAIAASLCYGALFAASRLYGEAGLQGVFVAVSLWGWWQWWRGLAVTRAAPGTVGSAPSGLSAPAPGVAWMSPQSRWIMVLATAAAWPLLGALLARLTDTDVPYADALPTAASVTGQLLLARKRVENWAVWLAVNLFSVGLFAYKALWLTALLYAVFAILSWVGLKGWMRLAAGAGPGHG